jgi:uncharacterized membrane protein YedE/YeeE
MAENNNQETSVRRSSSRRSSSSSRRKPKKSQLPYGMIAILIIVAIGIFLGTKSATLALFWITGLGFGFILQKARFCFTASMRDPYLTGGTSLSRAVLIAFAITTIGFTAIKYGNYAKGLSIPGMSYVVPISLATIVGAFIFGIGMVIAGGCASGTLMRVGEGFFMQILSLIFFIVGSLLGAHDFGWWKYNFISKGKAIFLPDYFGWFGALIIQLLVIMLLYIAATKYEEKRSS